MLDVSIVRKNGTQKSTILSADWVRIRDAGRDAGASLSLPRAPSRRTERSLDRCCHEPSVLSLHSLHDNEHNDQITFTTNITSSPAPLRLPGTVEQRSGARNIGHASRGPPPSLGAPGALDARRYQELGEEQGQQSRGGELRAALLHRRAVRGCMFLTARLF